MCALSVPLISLLQICSLFSLLQKLDPMQVVCSLSWDGNTCCTHQGCAVLRVPFLQAVYFHGRCIGVVGSAYANACFPGEPVVHTYHVLTAARGHYIRAVKKKQELPTHECGEAPAV